MQKIFSCYLKYLKYFFIILTVNFNHYFLPYLGGKKGVGRGEEERKMATNFSFMRPLPY